MLTAALICCTVAGIVVFVRVYRPPEPPREPTGEVLEARVAALEVKVAGLPSLWEEERQRAEKAAERARYHARKRSQREREEDDDDAGDDADEGDDVRGFDGGAGPAQGVLPLRGGVGQDDWRAERELIAQAHRAMMARSGIG